MIPIFLCPVHSFVAEFSPNFARTFLNLSFVTTLFCKCETSHHAQISFLNNCFEDLREQLRIERCSFRCYEVFFIGEQNNSEGLVNDSMGEPTIRPWCNLDI